MEGACIRASILLWVIMVLAGCGPRTAQVRGSGWVRVETRDVRLSTDLDAGRARDLGAQLQQMREYFGARLFPCARGIRLPPIEVIAPSRPDDIGALRTGVAGYFDSPDASWLEPHIVISAASVDETRAVHVFNHELAHRFVALCYPRAPPWLNEGIAELFETIRVVGRGRVLVGYSSWVFGDDWGHALDHDFRVIVPQAEVPSFSALRAMDARTFYGRDHEDGVAGRRGTLRYAASWSVVHMLEIGDPALHRRFGAYLHALRHREESEPALFRRLFAGVDMDAVVRRYQRSASFRSIYDELPEIDSIVAAVEPLDEADAHLLWAELFLRRGRSEEALEHLFAERALRPESARGAVLHGTMAWLDGDSTAARALFDQALDYDGALGIGLHARAAAALEDVILDERSFARLTELARTDEDLALLSRHALAAGRFEDALELGGRALRRNRLCWRCLHAVGRAYLGLDQPARAVGPLQSALALVAHGAASERSAIEAQLRGARAAIERSGGRSLEPIARAVSPAELRDLLRLHERELRSCHDAHAPTRQEGDLPRARPRGSLLLRLRLLVAGSGVVREADVVTSNIPTAALSECIERRARGWTFPPSADGASLELDVPVEVRPRLAPRR